MPLNRQKEIRAELIANMVVAGVERPKIARALDMTYPNLRQLMSTPEYQIIEERIANQVKGQMDEITSERVKRRLALKEEVEDAVSDAIQVLLQKLRKDKDLRAALEILDRDPQHDFAKGSRQAEVKLKTPAISSEAMSNALKEAEITQKIIQAAEKLTGDEKFPEA